MQYNNFINEMRPECIFMTTQLGERNPMLRGPLKTNVQIQSPKSIPGLTDLRDYDSYPDLYWQLRSDTISQPEDLEGEMLDRDLYKLKQISNLKLSTLESAVQHDPFRKWRGKAGDPLFCPVRNVQDRQRRGKMVMDPPKKANKSFQRVDGNTPRLKLEVKSTPIRPEQEEFKKSAEAISQSSKQDIETDSVTLNLLDQSSERNISIEAGSSSESKSTVHAPPNTYVRLEPDDDDEKYINLSKELFRKSPNAKHRREVVKEVMRPTVVSFDLKREDDYKNHRQTIPRRYQIGLMTPRHDHVAWASPCRKMTPRPQSVTSGDTLKENFHRENQHQSLIPRNGGRDGDAVCNDVYSLPPQSTSSITRPTQLHGNDGKTAREARDGDNSSFYSRRKSSPAPLKAIHLEVFNERVKVNDLGKISRSTFDPDIPGYKLDLINYPPNNSSQICSGPKTTASDSNFRFCDPVESTSRVRSKHAHTAPKKRTRKPNRPSRSADSTCLKITAYV